MAKPAWYAHTTWADTDRAEFFARLHAVAGANEQAACLRKQAAHLLKAHTQETMHGARELYELLLAQFPESSDLAYVHTALGEVLEETAEEAALDAYRAALVTQSSTTRSTDAHFRFGLLVIRAQRTDLFAEAQRHLDADSRPLVYPLDQYRRCGIAAHLAAARGERVKATLYARDALTATRHVAVDGSTAFHTRLEEWAG